MNSLARYLRRPVGDPAADCCTGCGARRTSAERAGVRVALVCLACDLVMRWPGPSGNELTA